MKRSSFHNGSPPRGAHGEPEPSWTILLDHATRSNGAAFVRRQQRHGVPLDYVAIKQCGAILELHRLVARGDVPMDAALPAMHHQLIALLALQNMLGKSAYPVLAQRLLGGGRDALSTWLSFICSQGDPSGLEFTYADRLDGTIPTPPNLPARG